MTSPTRVVATYTSLGKERQHEGDFAEAAEHFETALAVLERWRGATHISLAEVLDSLGDLARRCARTAPRRF